MKIQWGYIGKHILDGRKMISDADVEKQTIFITFMNSKLCFKPYSNRLTGITKVCLFF